MAIADDGFGARAATKEADDGVPGSPRAERPEFEGSGEGRRAGKREVRTFPFALPRLAASSTPSMSTDFLVGTGCGTADYCRKTPDFTQNPVSQVGLLRLTGGDEENEPGRGTHQERQRAGTRPREPSSASVGKARFCHRCRRLGTERRVVFYRRSRGQEGHAKRDP